MTPPASPADAPLPPARGGVHDVPLEDLVESGTNRALGDLAELVDSIKRLGVLQPLLVRPNPRDEATYEVVAGHRRLAAARAAGLSILPVMVRDLDDRQALEVQLVENLQRKDLHPLEEADGYRLLIERHGHSPESLAARLHKSKAYVYGRLKLNALAKPLHARFVAGELDASQALLVARIPDPKRQKEAWDGLTNDPSNYRAAADWVRAEFMLELAGAPFDTTDAGLLAKAGACGPCPKRTGNAPDLFGDVGRADVCTDPGCFRAKVDASFAHALEAHQAAGGKLVAKKAAAGLFHGGRLSYAGEREWVEVDKADGAFGKKTLRKLLGEALPPPRLAQDDQGAAHLVLPRKEALAAVRKAGLETPAREKPEKATRERSPERTRQDLERSARREAGHAAVAACLAAAAKGDHLTPGASEHVELAWALLEALAFEGADHDSLVALVPKQGAKMKTRRLGGRARGLAEAARQAVASMDLEPRQLALLLLLLRQGVTEWGSEPFEEPLVTAAGVLGVDLPGIYREALALAKKAGKKKPAAKARAKA